MTLVDVEDLLRVPDHSLQVAGKHDLVVAGGEDLSQGLAIPAELFPLAFDLRNDLNRKCFNKFY